MAATAPRKPTIIQYFRTGLFTRRSALFAPLRVIGIQVILLNDALIDGQDMELLDTYQLQRRPGWSRFCAAPLGANETINQFSSQRNAIGTVFPCFDSNTRFATFSPTAITTLWTKGTANQAFSQIVGTQMYICNGAAGGQKRYDTVAGTLHNIGMPAPTTAPTVTPPTTGSTFWQPNTAYLSGPIIMDPNGDIQQSTGGTSGATQPNWLTGISAHTTDGTGGLTWDCLGPLGLWAANTAFTPPSVILDSNGNVQQCTVGGTTGGTQPTWKTVVTQTTTDGTVTWTMLGNGNFSAFNGWVYVYVYSTQAPTVQGGYYHRSDASPASITTGPVLGSGYNAPIAGSYSNNPDCGSIDIYRTKDGGSTLDYLTSIPNVVGTGTWTVDDNFNDAALNSSIVVPLGSTLLNDPPPGSPGTHSPTGDAIGQIIWWNGRFWAISNGPSGCKVYFTAGPDVQNGDPYACWPPANVFTYPGQGMALAGTSQGLMLVFLADSVKIVGGGPTTLSYYPDDLLDNFGISSPNCMSKDGDTIRVLTTQGQCVELTVSAQTEISAYIGDIVQTFPAAASYLTNHRNGLDKGVFLSDGSLRVLRYGLNVQAWSPIYKPVGGVGALRSIETSVGNMTLCAARPGAGGFILGRNLSSFQDDGQPYSNCFATIGNIVLSQPLEPLIPVYRIAGYFAAGGQTPILFVMPNEVTASTGPGFQQVFNPIPEPSLGATASTTLNALEWNLYEAPTLNTSLFMHHLQVKVSFPQENFASTIYGIALKHEMEDKS